MNPDSADVLPVFDIGSVLGKHPESYSAEDFALCKGVAECLHQTGCLIVHDPRVPADMNDQFLDLLERYFGQPTERKLEDCRPSLDYQVGATPPGTEVPRCVVDAALQEQLRRLQAGNQATTPTGADAKWRFMWRVGPRPAHTAFPELNAEPVVPKAFPEWRAVMDGWGAALLGAATAVAGLAAVGLGLQPAALQELMCGGPHLLAPTGSDLDVNSRTGGVLAGYHYDLNLLTVHGRSRFPGLYVWLRDGRRVAVRIPAGCLLMQAGKQLEWLTGGHIRAGMHEVVVTEATLAAADAARAAGRSTWRVSSTVFTHCCSDALLRPLGRFGEQAAAQQQPQQQQPQQQQQQEAVGGAAGEAAGSYPAMKAGEQVQRELEAICLRKVGADATNVSCPGSGGNSGANSGCSSGSGSGKGEGLGVGSSRAGNGVSSSGSGLAGPHTTATGVAVAGNR
ncbi:hypothetical protein CHLRE_13g586400v5 [Chlamydomonas reinhardtii]|uniref:Isopenicillin N synthase-like Fe(2+) 2OG dioxygenase domain-containing protein n=1 Tax=Chlamydomonas reinhardtii TaxID=3055 RepID=A0A2K3D0Q6_CHLRE|nr:uncharacterized protein CHLRE_13g586400v5 [Chlamydomonas reinhardtii]PNW74125.1 hypothetical protein CHLRE_13g586400v5 [Chlamydomonas reinhardtii]